VRGARRQTLEIARKQANIEKFAALGRLSAGVAHEINNPVGGILTCLETLKDLEPGSNRYREYLQLVRSGLERIGKIVRQLLRFSRQQPDGERQKVDVNAIIEEVTVLSLFHNQKGEVEVIRRSGDLPKVDGVPDLLNQVFLNIVLNALQAMPKGGVLTIATWAEDGHVHASFEDTGPGIPEENLESIFEPFFTTKKVGVGTGLGLSVALGIVEAHGGRIEVGRGQEDGANFTVSIPVDVPDVPDPALVLEEAL
jgi:signal transduction histidine kinase